MTFLRQDLRRMRRGASRVTRRSKAKHSMSHVYGNVLVSLFERAAAMRASRYTMRLSLGSPGRRSCKSQKDIFTIKFVQDGQGQGMDKPRLAAS